MGLEHELQLERTWERRREFLTMNPAGEVPVLIEEDGTTLVEASVIWEYLSEVYPDVDLIGPDAVARAECRRLATWFNVKFGIEVTDNLIGEKIMKRFQGQGYPNSDAIRAGKANIHYHLQYISYLADRRNWLSGDVFSLADIAAGAHLSTIDYIGDVPWDDHPGAKDWYARIKSRPSFQPLLADTIPGMTPVPHYADLDF
jgi:glutathione S-transferase